MPDIQFRGVPAKEAIENIRSKARIPTKRWDEMLGEAHAKGFTVAGATKADLLQNLHDDVTAAIENGESIGQFRARFDETVQKHGWTYKGKRGWRSGVIYSANMRTAHAAGRWKQIERNKELKPYLIYMTVGDERVRHNHRLWRGMAFPVDHTFWSTHYPPNGWGCRCYVISATKAQLERMGIKVMDEYDVKTTERINAKTGEIYGDVPAGIDVGWDYNVGKAWIESDVAYGKKLIQLNEPLQKLALNDVDIPALNRSWKSWLKQVDSNDKPRGYAHTVGYLDHQTVAALQSNNVFPDSAAIVIYDNQTSHLRGNHKDKSKAIPEDWLQNLPLHLRDYQAVLLHNDDVIFILPDKVDGKNGRAVVQVNFKRKGEIINSVRSLGVMDIKSFRKKEYKVILGELK